MSLSRYPLQLVSVGGTRSPASSSCARNSRLPSPHIIGKTPPNSRCADDRSSLTRFRNFVVRRIESSSVRDRHWAQLRRGPTNGGAARIEVRVWICAVGEEQLHEFAVVHSRRRSKRCYRSLIQFENALADLFNAARNPVTIDRPQCLDGSKHHQCESSLQVAIVSEVRKLVGRGQAVTVL